MAALSFTFFVVLASPAAALISANEFLMSQPNDFEDHISEAEVLTGLLQEIESSLPDSVGNGRPSTRFAEIEASLRPIYSALPKNEHGNLESTVARYGLHRLFMQRHGWLIKGLGPSSGKYNTSSPVGILKEQVPAFVEEIFELRLGGKGFKLRDLAVLASTIEHLVQEESIHRMAAAFKIYDPPQFPLAEALNMAGDNSFSLIKDVLDTYMAGFILSANLTEMTPSAAHTHIAEMPDLYVHWNETLEFVYNIYRKVTEQNDLSSSQAHFAALTETVEAVGDQFGGFFHNTVCQTLKDKLMSLEYRGTGRIKLSEFYKPVFDGFWQFQESVGYLRELGVLEETDPKEPSILIANYMVAPTNCIAFSGFYAACCINECEGLLQHIEENVASPVAKPAAIATLVESFPSSTVPAPRILSATLLQRLDEIAANHGGAVPLHGRLFAQWMHHAYPRECPYPHISGTTSPKLPEEWLEASGIDSLASEEEMLQYIKWSNNGTRNDHVMTEDLMMWAGEEELLVVRPQAYGSPGTSEKPTAKRSMLMFAVAGSLGYALVQTMKATLADSREAPKKFAI